MADCVNAFSTSSMKNILKCGNVLAVVAGTVEVSGGMEGSSAGN